MVANGGKWIFSSAAVVHRFFAPMPLHTEYDCVVGDTWYGRKIDGWFVLLNILLSWKSILDEFRGLYRYYVRRAIPVSIRTWRRTYRLFLSFASLNCLTERTGSEQKQKNLEISTFHFFHLLLLDLILIWIYDKLKQTKTCVFLYIDFALFTHILIQRHSWLAFYCKW